MEYLSLTCGGDTIKITAFRVGVVGESVVPKTKLQVDWMVTEKKSRVESTRMFHLFSTVIFPAIQSVFSDVFDIMEVSMYHTIVGGRHSLMAIGFGDNFIWVRHTVDDVYHGELGFTLDDAIYALTTYVYRQTEDVKVVLGDLEYDNKITKCISTSSEKTCVICMDTIMDGDNIHTTKCNHSFHGDCLERWLKVECIHPKCPMCNTDIRD